MPDPPIYPGVYIEEVPSGVRTIVGVATSITAFIGRALRGSVNEPIRIQSFADFERIFGGLWLHSTMSYSVQHYFLNGGMDAIIVRVHNDAIAATLSLPADRDTLSLEATSHGAWSNNLRAAVDYNTEDSSDTNLFSLMIEEVDPDTNEVRASETFRNISINDSRFITKVLEHESELVRVQGNVPSTRPDTIPSGNYIESSGTGNDGNALSDNAVTGSESNKTGLYALEKTDLFNLLCIPPLTRDTDIGSSTLSAALAFCKKRRALLLVDSPSSWNDVASAVSGVDTLGLQDENAAVYFPRVNIPDPLQENRLEEFVPCGAVAGVYARTDAQRGVWKAPAGLEATLTGIGKLSYKLTEGECGQLSPLGVNCLRTFPEVGHVVWGARTLVGADQLASDWKYITVRRLALFIEESLYRGIKWVVFEPNDEPLWAKIRLNIGAFMQNLFRQWAFQGTTPREAYFVKCDSETTTQDDIDRGIVNILVGFAPLKPAEFVIIKIKQIAGQS
jgi:phage tail sheath protein FI